ncbi:unnamed protein product [Hyaloperonospora brassicae]|uniref:Alpha-ketoglutarate-dependent dioxygenase AlkB-like domain-containing protein n=1 Tax=Hyaloperonospora brassicae TaxID=162125 RepID=A0AAV0U7E9_HYABA|nr:unnamed protein product [Hyaloperonospora brassicae]
MSDASSSSESGQDILRQIDSDDLFEDTEAQQAKRRTAEQYVEHYAERDWGLAARQRRVQGAGKDVVTENTFELSPGKNVVFHEKQGQQAKVWDCALVLAKFLANETYFPRGFFADKRVIELGCGIGVPGLAAAALGAKEVLLTDMPLAIAWIQVNIARNQALGCIPSNVCARALLWGDHKALGVYRSFDVVLCSDLVYGHGDVSQKLVQTIVQLSHPRTLIVSAHEARLAGDRGAAFFSLLSAQQFQVEPSLWPHAEHLDTTRCHDPLLRDDELQVVLDVVTEDEERLVADECTSRLRRRRYEENHWDNVIVKFKEMERSRWSAETLRILQKVREAAVLPQELNYFPAVHVIELAEDGYIRPHVDSVKFSGRVVAGLSLLSPSIMRFQEEHGDSVIDAYLPRRSMYMITGRIRYHYMHAILPGTQLFREHVRVNRTRRISIMLRDEFAEEHVAKYHTPFVKPDKETQ